MASGVFGQRPRRKGNRKKRNCLDPATGMRCVNMVSSPSAGGGLALALRPAGNLMPGYRARALMAFQPAGANGLAPAVVQITGRRRRFDGPSGPQRWPRQWTQTSAAGRSAARTDLMQFVDQEPRLA